MNGSRSALLVASLAAVVALAVFAAIAVPARAAVPTNFNVSVHLGNDAEDAIAVNPTNPSNVVAMAIGLGPPRTLVVGTTFNGGQTWTRQTFGEGDWIGDFCCDEQIAWDRFGNLWLTYLTISSGSVFVAVSTDGGISFTKEAEIVPTTPTGSKAPAGAGSKRLPPVHLARFGDQPSIAVGPNSVWVSYTSVPSEVVQASGAPVSGLGQFGSFSAVETVPTSDGRGDYGNTAVGPNGQVMVTYQDSTHGQGGSHVYTALDPDGLGSAGFDDPRLLARSYVGGFDYLPVQPDRSVDAEANLAWDNSGGVHNGRVYAVWTQELPNESDDMNIMFQYSDDYGTTWTPAVKLNDDHTTKSQVLPSIAVDQTTGNVAVSWYDARNDAGTGGSGDTDGIPNTDVQIWATYSTDGGASFVPNFRVSAGTSNAVAAQTGFDYGDYTHAAFQSGAFWPAWSDNSNSTGNNPDGTLHKLDLYAAKVTIG